MDKLTIATQVLLKLIETNKTGFDAEGISGYAWEIADAMQAEAEKRKPIGLPDALKEEWQPDWSQAPEWANWWSITKHGQGHWFLSEPKVIEESWVRATRECKQAPSFDYQGNWQDSLRKRPQ